MNLNSIININISLTLQYSYYYSHSNQCGEIQQRWSMRKFLSNNILNRISTIASYTKMLQFLKFLFFYFELLKLNCHHNYKSQEEIETVNSNRWLLKKKRKSHAVNFPSQFYFRHLWFIFENNIVILLLSFYFNFKNITSYMIFASITQIWFRSVVDFLIHNLLLQRKIW